MAYRNGDCVCGFCPNDCGCACHRTDSLSCIDILEAILRIHTDVKTAVFAEFSRNDLFEYINTTFTMPQKRLFQQLVTDDPNWKHRHSSKRSKSLIVPSNVAIIGDLLRHDDRMMPKKTIKKASKKRCVSV